MEPVFRDRPTIAHANELRRYDHRPVQKLDQGPQSEVLRVHADRDVLTGPHGSGAAPSRLPFFRSVEIAWLAFRYTYVLSPAPPNGFVDFSTVFWVSSARRCPSSAAFFMLSETHFV